MATIARIVYQAIRNVNFELEKDPRVQHLPLVGNATPVVCIIALYVVFVTKIGPRWMKDRKPFNVKPFIRLHNFVQIILNGYGVIIGVKHSYYRDDYSLTCQPSDVNNNAPYVQKLLLATYIYYITKYLDLLDTVFFVLRKKNNHISFLHVYHHAIMVFAVWLYLKFYFGGHPTMLGLINAFVHVLMYTYYLITSLDVKVDLLFWKKMITRIQIMQFVYLIFHFTMPLVNNWCNLNSNFINTVALIQNIFMAAMFSDFYYKTYIKKGPNKKLN